MIALLNVSTMDRAPIASVAIMILRWCFAPHAVMSMLRNAGVNAIQKSEYSPIPWESRPKVPVSRGKLSNKG